MQHNEYILCYIDKLYEGVLNQDLNQIEKFHIIEK